MGLGKKTILVVDDEKDIRVYLSIFLRYKGFDVIEATNGQEAYKLIQNRAIDLLILDINMPKLDGLTLSEKIQKQGDKTPIIIVSSHTDKDKLFRAIKLNVVDYIIKPFTRKSIREALKKAFENDKISNQVVKFQDGYSFNLETLTLFKNSEFIKLSLHQSLAIEMLIRYKNRVVKAEDIFYHINDSYSKIFNGNSIRNLIKRVRTILPNKTIETVYGVGYKMVL
ncbi:response regulator transcription factor [Sulfurovum sp. bin170]|uniref:response regulator transcription factor n=1 Tax=Sulfurovum sp. bin170 TaxID=2695268 RepID=UPI0013DEEDF3|nr:response regulator transcription factor [Sulfurovum sp. bin170]NEW60124.1 response regulator transcription factor [Sulfurovum sp. bin170]